MSSTSNAPCGHLVATTVQASISAKTPKTIEGEPNWESSSPSKTRHIPTSVTNGVLLWKSPLLLLGKLIGCVLNDIALIGRYDTKPSSRLRRYNILLTVSNQTLTL
jgi:hypothetical protein